MKAIKKFKNNSKIIKDLPEEIQKVLLGDFKDIIEEDISKIAKIDPLEIPPGIFLKNEAHLDQKKINHVKTTSPTLLLTMIRRRTTKTASPTTTTAMRKNFQRQLQGTDCVLERSALKTSGTPSNKLPPMAK